MSNFVLSSGVCYLVRCEILPAADGKVRVLKFYISSNLPLAERRASTLGAFQCLDSIVGVATMLSGRLGVQIAAGARDCLLQTRPDRLWGPPGLQLVQGLFARG